MATIDAVADAETLYRAVRDVPQNFPISTDGTRHVSSQVYADRLMRPSVDRAALRENNPTASRFAPDDGVLSIGAATIRAISETRNDANWRPVTVHVADVEPVPLPDNPAHAEIYGVPSFDNKSVFRRVCERLAQDSTWIIAPESLREK